jgi:hypothetical protein
LQCELDHVSCQIWPTAARKKEPATFQACHDCGAEVSVELPKFWNELQDRHKRLAGEKMKAERHEVVSHDNKGRFVRVVGHCTDDNAFISRVIAYNFNDQAIVVH